MAPARHDDCAARWKVERDRLVMFRRQRALVHCGPRRPEADVETDKVALDVAIGLTRELMDGICDEHNGHTVGTYEHLQRGPHVPVKEPA